MSRKDKDEGSNLKLLFTQNIYDTVLPDGFTDNPVYITSFNSLNDITEKLLSSNFVTNSISSESLTKVSVKDKNIEIPSKPEAKDINLDRIAYKFVQSLQNYPFESGYNSFADIELQSIKNDIADSEFFLLIQKISKFCLTLKTNTEMLHYLNCLLNLAKDVDTDIFFNCGVAAISHKDIEIREAGIALFEKMANSTYADVLENIADTGIVWLDKYKNDVVNDLRTLH